MMKLSYLPLLVASASGLAAAEPVVRTYPINGRTGPELVAQMAALGPAQDDGTRFPGGAQWSIDWQYRLAGQGARCRLEQVRATLDSTITLPHWQQQEQADSALSTAWRTFLERLEVHEHGHVQQGMDAAAAIRTALDGMTGRCADLAAQANLRGQQIIEQYNQRDRDYDTQTGHGRTQGAVLSY